MDRNWNQKRLLNEKWKRFLYAILSFYSSEDDHNKTQPNNHLDRIQTQLKTDPLNKASKQVVSVYWKQYEQKSNRFVSLLSKSK